MTFTAESSAAGAALAVGMAAGMVAAMAGGLAIAAWIPGAPAVRRGLRLRADADRDATDRVAVAPRFGLAESRVRPLLLPGVVALLCWWLGAGLWGAGACGAVLAAAVRGRRGRARRAVLEAEQALVLEACGVLVDEVRSGRHPVEALARAGELDPWFARAHSAAVAGTDVPAALRGSTRGAHRAVAAAWQVAERQGAGLAPALTRVVAQLRADRATARVVASELASARATSRLLVALPAVALVGATLSGGRPWEFLLGPGVGQFCLVLGLLCGGVGLRWIDAIGDSVAGVGR